MKTEEEIEKLAEEAYPVNNVYVDLIGRHIDYNATPRMYWIEGYKAAQSNAFEEGFQEGCRITANDIMSRI